VDGKHLSLARIDARLERERVKISFAHTGVAAFFPSERRAALAKMERLKSYRLEIEDQIGTRQKELSADRERADATIKILREISEGEERTREEISGEKRIESVSPIYTRAELTRMERRAHWMHNAVLFREVYAARMASRERLAPEKREPLEALAARAFAHESIAEFDLKEAGEARGQQAKRSRFTFVAARLPDGSIVTGSLRQTEILTRAEAIIHIIENTSDRRDARDSVIRAAATRDAHARSRFEAVSEYFNAARSIAGDFRQELAREGKELPAPAFTKSELDRLDLSLIHTTNAEDRLRSREILDRSEAKSQPFLSRVFSGRSR